MTAGAHDRWRYAPGGGLLLGTGARWLLLADQPDEAVIVALWEALTDLGLEQALAVLEQAYAGRVPSAAGWEAGRSVTRGAGSVGDDDELTVGLAVDGPWLPLLGGIVAGAAVRPVAPAAGATAEGGRRLIDGIPDEIAAPAAGTSAEGGRRLIDGIPDEIAASVGPDVPRRYDGRVARLGGTDTEPPAAAAGVAVGPAAVDAPPVAGPTPHPDLPSGSTTRRTPVPAAAPAPTPDHDGHTTFRQSVPASPAADRPGDRPVDHLRQPTHETVLAVVCANGHPTPAYSPECRVCHGEVPPQDPRRIPRPRLGGLRLPGGEVVALDRSVVIGRRPVPVDDHGEWPHLVTVPAEASYVSRVHVHIQLDGWLVVARDLGSRGGTTLRVPGRAPEAIRAQEPHVLEPGHALDLADEYQIVYDVTPELTA